MKVSTKPEQDHIADIVTYLRRLTGLRADGEIDYSKYSRAELLDAKRFIDKAQYPVNYQRLSDALELAKERQSAAKNEIRLPKIDVFADSYSSPTFHLLSFGPKCPACGWLKPVFRPGTSFGKSLECPDCFSMLRVTKFHRILNGLLISAFVPFFAWFSFGDLGTREQLQIGLGLSALAFFEYWFTRLEILSASAK